MTYKSDTERTIDEIKNLFKLFGDKRNDTVYEELEGWQKQAVDKGNYDSHNFEEEELEDDDFYYEDDKE